MESSAYSGLSEPPNRALRRWLFWCIVAVYLAIVVGGITRLTESGLSITEWKPVAGIFPPLTEQGWADAFAAFQAIPQAQSTHQGITLVGFKFIYWWEWLHRIVARGVGLVFAIPYVVYLLRGMIPSHLRLRLALLPILTLGQGVLGWYMVQSGLVGRTEVSAYRLAAHLGLALAILFVALWTWADLGPRRAEPAAARGWRRAVLAVTVLIGITVMSGAFVAGLRAGALYNTFPLMGTTFVPLGYSLMPSWWTNAFENPIAAQFHHRILAMLTGAFALVLAWRAGRSSLTVGAVKTVRHLGGIVLVQVVIGVVTLLLVVPVALGALHQLVGVGALTAGVLAVHRLSGRPAPK
ncbi:MAG: COX15/CtaA family protein [Gemmatimonadales bacterium]